MKLGEAVLRSLSEDPSFVRQEGGVSGESGASDPLLLLRTEVPDFVDLIQGKRVVDFGCGEGEQIEALLREGAGFVYGIDTNEDALERARTRLGDSQIDRERFALYNGVSNEIEGKADLVISQNAMEHFPDPRTALEQMLSLVGEDGRTVISFGPPWYAPYGSHMHFFCRVPWLNLLFSERTVMRVRAAYRDDGALRYEDVESGLNKMTVARFERLLKDSKVTPEYFRLRCVKGQNWMARIPVIRELFVNHITCIARRDGANSG